jgi:hypothetical protein
MTPPWSEEDERHIGEYDKYVQAKIITSNGEVKDISGKGREFTGSAIPPTTNETTTIRSPFEGVSALGKESGLDARGSHGFRIDSAIGGVGGMIQNKK